VEIDQRTVGLGFHGYSGFDRIQLEKKLSVSENGFFPPKMGGFMEEMRCQATGTGCCSLSFQTNFGSFQNPGTCSKQCVKTMADQHWTGNSTVNRAATETSTFQLEIH
jgi:hypothetical protein